MYRVLRDPPEPRHPPLPSPISGPGRLADRADQGDVIHWERAGQQRLGREQPGADEALSGLHKVGLWEGLCLRGVLPTVRQPEMTLVTATGAPALLTCRNTGQTNTGRSVFKMGLRQTWTTQTPQFFLFIFTPWGLCSPS